MTLSRGKFVAFALIAAGLSFGIVAGALLGADLYLHHRAERSAGLNRHGYRGPVAGGKRPGELRVVVLGASTVFGYGVLWDEAFPAVLERRLNDSAASGPPSATVANLGYNGEGAFAMRPTLEDFASLDYDVVVLYPGDTDHMGDGGFNTALYRHQSAVFRLTGYLPILPLALTEKAMSLRSVGHLEDAYNAETPGREPTPVPGRSAGILGRASATVMEVTSKVLVSLGGVLDHLAPTAPAMPPLKGTAAGCASPWIRYCEAVYEAITYARAAGKGVVVLQSPTRPDRDEVGGQAIQQGALTDMLARKFGHDPAVALVPLAEVLDLSDPKLSPDGSHATPEGNALIAGALVEPVRRVSRNRGATPQ